MNLPNHLLEALQDLATELDSRTFAHNATVRIGEKHLKLFSASRLYELVQWAEKQPRPL